jgi:hypothetical protein
MSSIVVGFQTRPKIDAGDASLLMGGGGKLDQTSAKKISGKEMAVWRRRGLLWQKSPGFHEARRLACASWRALGGRTAGARALAFLHP